MLGKGTPGRTAVDEEIAAVAIGQREIAREIEMLRRHALRPAFARRVRIDAVISNAGRPPVNSQSVAAGRSPDSACSIVSSWLPRRLTTGTNLDRRSRQQPPQHARGIRAAIDVVAWQQQRCIDRTPCQVLGDDRMQIAKLLVTAVDIADRVDTSPFRQVRGRTGKCDH